MTVRVAIIGRGSITAFRYSPEHAKGFLISRDFLRPYKEFQRA